MGWPVLSPIGGDICGDKYIGSTCGRTYLCGSGGWLVCTTPQQPARRTYLGCMRQPEGMLAELYEVAGPTHGACEVAVASVVSSGWPPQCPGTSWRGQRWEEHFPGVWGGEGAQHASIHILVAT